MRLISNLMSQDGGIRNGAFKFILTVVNAINTFEK